MLQQQCLQPSAFPIAPRAWYPAAAALLCYITIKSSFTRFLFCPSCGQVKDRVLAWPIHIQENNTDVPSCTGTFKALVPVERDPLAASWWRKIRREREDSRGRCSSAADENLVLGKWGGTLWWISSSGGGKKLRTSRADWEEQESDDARPEVSGGLICLKRFQEAELCWMWLVGDFWDFS